MRPEEFSKEMWDCWRDASVSYSAFARKMGVDVSELYVVDVLWDTDEGMTQKSICEQCDMGKQTVSAVCKRLVAGGFVVAHPSATDKRERIMLLTDEGRDRWRSSVERMREIEAMAAEAIPAKDADAFLRAIKRYVDVLQREMR